MMKQNVHTYRWAEEILKPAAKQAYAGEGNYQCGEWCQFCKAKYDCRKRAEANMALAQYDFKFTVEFKSSVTVDVDE